MSDFSDSQMGRNLLVVNFASEKISADEIQCCRCDGNMRPGTRKTPSGPRLAPRSPSGACGGGSILKILRRSPDCGGGSRRLALIELGPAPMFPASQREPDDAARPHPQLRDH